MFIDSIKRSGLNMKKINLVSNKELLEVLGHIEHKQWAHWQAYLHSKCIENEDGSLTIPAEFVSRWKRQINTEYAQLSEKEQLSDQEQVQEYVSIIQKYLDDPCGNSFKLNG